MYTPFVPEWLPCLGKLDVKFPEFDRQPITKIAAQ